MKLILVAAFAGLALLAPVPQMARASSPQGTSTRPAPARTPDQVLKMYDARLSLTEDQKARLKPMIADRQQQMLALRDDTSTKGRQKMKKMQDIMSSSDTKIRATLTPEQQKKYADMEAEQKEKMKEHREAKTKPDAS